VCADRGSASGLGYRKETAIPVKEEKIELDGEVVEALRSSTYRVSVEGRHEVLCYTAGKMRKFRIRIVVGDRVRIELSPYDLSRGRIVYRHRGEVPART
jgi:translation initiation factor IF-1